MPKMNDPNPQIPLPFATLSVPINHPNADMLEKMHFLLHSALTAKNGLFLQNLIYLNDNLLSVYIESKNEESTIKTILDVYDIAYK